MERNETRTVVGGGGGRDISAPSLGGGAVSVPLPGFWYPLFLVFNGTTFEGQFSKLSDIFRIVLV